MILPKTPSFRLNGKRALVAGASSGIGLACAVALAESGAEVLAVARSKELLSDLEISCKKKGYRLSTFCLDITNFRATKNLLKERGIFDIVVNSVGIARHNSALETRIDDFDKVMAINVKAAFFLAQQSAQQMILGSKPGSIITISSQMAFVGGVHRSVYCASKQLVSQLF